MVTKTKTRAKHACPELLQLLLAKVNLFPPDAIASDSVEILKANRLNGGDADTGAQLVFEDYLATVPVGSDTRSRFQGPSRGTVREIALNAAKERAGSGTGYEEDYDRLVYEFGRFWCEALFEHREALREIADYFRLRRTGGDIEGSPIAFPPWPRQITMLVSVECTLLRALPDEFQAAIDGVDADRIRRCEHCDRLFWAKRLEAFACSTRCSSAVHTKRSKERKKAGAEQPEAREARNKRRRANRATKNRIERIKSNGTL